MKRKKKITVSYLEKKSKREGLQGLCRIVHDGVSTMFKIGVVEEDDTKEWFSSHKHTIQQLLELERDILKEEFTVKGFHYRWDTYNAPITYYLEDKYVIAFLSMDLQNILTVKEDIQINERTDILSSIMPFTIAKFYALLSSGLDDAKLNEVSLILRDTYLPVLNLELFNLIFPHIYAFEPKCYNFLLDRENISELYSSFLSKTPVHYINYVLNDSIKEKLNAIYSSLGVTDMNKDVNLVWLKSELDHAVKHVFRHHSHNPLAKSIFTSPFKGE